MLLLGLSTGHKVGLALAAAGFAGFSLIVSMLVPRWRPQFPGRGLPFFLAVCALMFVGMLSAVAFFGKESESKAAGVAVKVSELEYKIRLPETSLKAGVYTFEVRNEGKLTHNLTVNGPGGPAATSDIGPGSSATLTVKLKPGSYDVFCSLPGHKQLGMEQKVTVT